MQYAVFFFYRGRKNLTWCCVLSMFNTLWYSALCCLCFTLERKEFDIVQCAIHVLNFDTVHCAVFVLHKEENVTHCNVCCPCFPLHYGEENLTQCIVLSMFYTLTQCIVLFMFYTMGERIWHSAVCCPCSQSQPLLHHLHQCPQYAHC